MNPRYAIVAIADSRYAQYAYILFKKLRSVGVTLDLYLLADFTLSSMDMKISSEIEISPIEISQALDQLVEIDKSRHVSRATYAKFLIPKYLPQSKDRILYLDVDLLVRRNPEFLFDREFHYGLAAVVETQSNGSALFNTSDESYFNAGVLMMDLAYWRENDIFEKFIEKLKIHGNLPLQDQDYLNLIFRHKWDILPMTANLFAESPITQPHLSGLVDPMIVHFNGPLKPWNTHSNKKFYREWQEFAHGTGLWGEPFRKAKIRTAVRSTVHLIREMGLFKSLSKLLPIPLKRFILSHLLRL